MIRHAMHGLLAGAWPVLCAANCPDERPALEQEFRASEAVVIGPIVGETFTPASNEHEEGLTYRVRVQDVLRGTPGKTVTFFSTSKNRQFALKKGRTYLLFINEDAGLVTIDGCGNSGPLPERDEVLARLRRLYGE